MKRILSPTGWGIVLAPTIAGTLFCIAAALIVDYPNFADMSDAQFRRAVTVDVLLPMGLAGPLFFLLMSKIRQLNIARRDLEILASTDSLTRILNRGAFTMLVDAYLEKAGKREDAASGAFLVVDADRFKLINDRLGHKHGDDALVSIAGTIKASLRETDLVGRVGGEEFGVFLPRADSTQAEAAAERIRANVANTDFRPQGRPYGLSVSVGGITYHRRTSYDELFQAADQRLYLAKKAGRDRVSMASLASFIDQRARTAEATAGLKAS